MLLFVKLVPKIPTYISKGVKQLTNFMMLFLTLFKNIWIKLQKLQADNTTRLIMSVRLMRQDADGKLHIARVIRRKHRRNAQRPAQHAFQRGHAPPDNPGPQRHGAAAARRSGRRAASSIRVAKIPCCRKAGNRFRRDASSRTRRRPPQVPGRRGAFPRTAGNG